MVKPKHVHQDPYRFPKLQEPIESGVIKHFDTFRKGVLIEVTKTIVKQKKQ